MEPPVLQLTIDSRSLFHLCTTTKEPTESLNKVDLAFIRELYDQGHLNIVRWSPGYCHIADGLTKENKTTASLLYKTLSDGQHAHHPDAIERRSPVPSPALPIITTSQRTEES